MSETPEEKKIREALEAEAEKAGKQADRANPAEALGKILGRANKKG